MYIFVLRFFFGLNECFKRNHRAGRSLMFSALAHIFLQSLNLQATRWAGIPGQRRQTLVSNPGGFPVVWVCLLALLSGQRQTMQPCGLCQPCHTQGSLLTCASTYCGTQVRLLCRLWTVALTVAILREMTCVGQLAKSVSKKFTLRVFSPPTRCVFFLFLE